MLQVWEKQRKPCATIFALQQRDNVSLLNGGIAQLGERLHGMQEVIGSIPFTSTKILTADGNIRIVLGIDPIV